jgi:dTDP-4-amino-4,6-dideoxygalactose transaminase
MMIMKQLLSDLAVLGGSPAFPEPLHVGRPNIGDRARLLSRMDDIFDRRWLSNNGPYVQEFEQAIESRLGVKHCIAMCNATIGLEIAIRAAGLTGEVIVPSLTFIATAHALQWQAITPVFCDVDPDSYTLDPARIEQLITPRTTGIIGVHLWGRACDVEGLTAVAQRHGLKLLFDAAHAFGSTHRGQMIGGFGNAEVFSFHATKFCNALEGGAVVTNDDDLAARVRLMKNFGFGGYDDVVYIGTNGKMNEVSAAMGLTSLQSMDEFIDTNRRNYEQYRDELAELPGVRLLECDPSEQSNFQYVVAMVDDERTGISRDQLVEACWAENVRVRRYFYPGCHRMQPYRSLYPWAGMLLPVTERAVASAITLPTGTALTPEDVSRVCQLLRFLVEHGADIREALNRVAELPSGATVADLAGETVYAA